MLASRVSAVSPVADRKGRKGVSMWRILWLGSVVLVAGCATSSQTERADQGMDPRSLQGEAWQWEGTEVPGNACTVDTPERYTLRFLSDGDLQVRLDCNRGIGTYEASVGSLSLGPIAATRMACPPDSLDGRYADDLQQVETFHVQGDRLHLGLADGGTMRFRRDATR
jgi:heat shock protein HslJ